MWKTTLDIFNGKPLHLTFVKKVTTCLGGFMINDATHHLDPPLMSGSTVFCKN